MAEFVQRRKEEMITEVPVLQSHFKAATVKRILNQREKFEYRLMRRTKQKSDFSQYIVFLKSVIKKVEKIGVQNTETLKLIVQHRNRIISLYQASLKYFKHDVSLWKEFIKFLVKHKRIRLLQKALDNALLLHGHVSDELYVFAVKQEFEDLKNIQKARETYIVGLRTHNASSPLYLEAFKCELAYSEILTQKVLKSGKEYNPNDPVLNGSVAKTIFETAVENIKDDFSLYFKMYQATTEYKFALSLSDEIKNYMSNTYSTDPNYWDTLATNELKNPANKTDKTKIKMCLLKYDEALSIIDTDVMWEKYLNTVLSLSSENKKTETFIAIVVRDSMYNAHYKNKLKPSHYIQWIYKSEDVPVNEIVDLAVEKYPNNTDILEIKLLKLIELDKQIAYEFFKQNANKVSRNLWLSVVQSYSNEPQIKELYDLVFKDGSFCSKEIRKELGNEYLLWLSKNKSLCDVRNAYNKLVMNNDCNASLCKTLVTIETKQDKIDIAKIRQHFTLACMQFGKTDIDLWMDRIQFEFKYGSPKLVSTTYHQALTTLNDEKSDQFAEEYPSKVLKFNQV